MDYFYTLVTLNQLHILYESFKMVSLPGITHKNENRIVRTTNRICLLNQLLFSFTFYVPSYEPRTTDTRPIT